MPKQFTVTDPRTFDGDAFSVAERACKQAEALAMILAENIPLAELMARNAQMSRNLMEDPEDANAAGWDTDIQHVKFTAAIESANEIVRTMQTLGRAAGFNPKARLPKS